MMKQTAIVTGASGGIGRAIALRLANDGWSVLLGCNNNEKSALELQNELRSKGLRAAAYSADVANRSEVCDMIRFAEERLGHVELVVNNAGTAHTGLFQDTDDEAWQHILDVNLTGPRNVIMETLPGMLKRKKGCIINISSIWGIRGASCEAAYSASKSALVGLTRSLAAELAPSGIRVNCIAPGCISTDMTLHLGDETVNILKEETPLGRLGTPEDIAATISFLADESAGFITGQVLTVDGGFTI